MSNILNKGQAEMIYSAMCALNNVGARLSANVIGKSVLDNIEVRENGVGEVIVFGARDCEIWANQNEFAKAYGLDMGGA